VRAGRGKIYQGEWSKGESWERERGKRRVRTLKSKGWERKKISGRME
jgi:hypothetical protein